MNKKTSIYIWLILLSSILALLFSSCGVAVSTSTPTPKWQPMPTFIYYVPSSDKPGYTHFIPSEGFKFYLEFDYPSYWWLEERVNEIGIPSLDLRDPRFLTLPPPSDDMHPTPNDFGYIYIWPIIGTSEQTPDARVELLKQNYSETSWMKVLRDYKIMIDGHGASVLEYQVDDPETSLSLMFCRRIVFMVTGQMYEIFFNVAEKDRGGEFDKGYDYFLNSLKIVQ